MAGQLPPDARLTRLRRSGLLALAGLAAVLGALGGWAAGASLTPRVRYVVRPEQPVFGVSVGSPVRVRGVVVGEVSAVRLWQAGPGEPLRPELALTIDPARCPGANKLADALAEGLRVEFLPVNPASGFLEVDLVWRPGAPAALASDDPLELPTAPAAPSQVSRAAGYLRALAEGDPAAEARALALRIEAAQVALADPPAMAAGAAESARKLRELAAGLEADLGEGAVPSLARLAEARERLRSLGLALEAAAAALRNAGETAPAALAGLRDSLGRATDSRGEPPPGSAAPGP